MKGPEGASWVLFLPNSTRTESSGEQGVVQNSVAAEKSAGHLLDGACFGQSKEKHSELEVISLYNQKGHYHLIPQLLLPCAWARSFGGVGTVKMGL